MNSNETPEFSRIRLQESFTDAAGAVESPTSRLRALVFSGMGCRFYSSVISIRESQKSAQRIFYLPGLTGSPTGKTPDHVHVTCPIVAGDEITVTVDRP